jgi:CheY-like chemotaxis protein
MARRLVPDAITLDLGLSDIDGWVLFDLLRHDPKTRRIPIHVISGGEDLAALTAKGAASVWTKPVEPTELNNIFRDIGARTARVQRNVLVLDSDADRRLSIVETLRDGVTSVNGLSHLPADVRSAELGRRYDAVVIGLGRSAAENAKTLAGFQPGASKLLLFSESTDAIDKAVAALPALGVGQRVHNRALLGAELAAVMGDARDEDSASVDQERPDAVDLAGARVLIVDDDIRNIYSLTSVLETFGIEVLHAERGQEGIQILDETPNIDAALIDIMMPDMDGYETMRAIRRRRHLKELPLISVTAKAMKGDREKCMEAGASDYIAKPVDLDLLLALLRVWVGRSRSRRETSAQSVVA